MTPQISVQLYTVRELAKKDFPGTIRALADIGFANVETAGYQDFTASEAVRLFRELDLKAPTAHVDLPVGENKNAIIDEALTMGHKYLITSCPPGFGDNFTSLDKVRAMADLYTEAAEFVAPHGLQIGYHNHHWDLGMVEGRRAHEVFFENTPKTVLFQADLFWLSRAGLDPVAFIQEAGVRGKTFHFKDGICSPEANLPEAENEGAKNKGPDAIPFRALGRGQLDLIAAAEAAKYAEFIVIEIDSIAGDMLEAVQESYRYLTTNNIAQGKK